MTILSPAPTQTQHTDSLLTGVDVLDIEAAIHNVAYHGVAPTIRDRQALALLTYDRAVCRAMPAMLIERILDGTYTLPLDERRAGLVLRLRDRLPAVSQQDEDAWLAKEDGVETAAQPVEPVAGPVERAERIIAARAARHNDSTGDALKWALRVLVAEMAHAAPSPISDAEQYAAHEHADRLVEQAARDHQAAEHGEQPAAPTLPTWKHDVTRADLAHVGHSITVEPITDDLRRDSELPAEATLVVVERHAGRLAKVCDTTDVHVAEYAEWGVNVTIEDVARGIAGTYGATYVKAAAAVTR